ncbi:MAG: type II toxin-antitoxin system HicB family antitoxin [Candidatus Helarchaeota archaeon]
MLLKFEIYNDGKYWCARAIGEDIFTQGKSLDELVDNIKEAVSVHFDELLGSGHDIKILSISEFEVSSIAKTTSSQR